AAGARAPGWPAGRQRPPGWPPSSAWPSRCTRPAGPSAPGPPSCSRPPCPGWSCRAPGTPSAGPPRCGSRPWTTRGCGSSSCREPTTATGCRPVLRSAQPICGNCWSPRSPRCWGRVRRPRRPTGN
ncbi:MAG: Hydrolase SCO5215, alpha/beta fold family, partial [uncultured Friedmanniella sp.]